MKILFTADLHMDSHLGAVALDGLRAAVCRENPDVVVVAGDLGIPADAPKTLVGLRSAAGERPVAAALGNHDFWLGARYRPQLPYLEHIVKRFWREPARDVGVVLLDNENLDLSGVSIVGGYGHYDLGHAVAGLCIDGTEISRNVYLSGGHGGLFWEDFRYIPCCAANLAIEARREADGISGRMDAAIESGRRLLLAVHTCPWPELNGYPLTGGVNDILAAYSGNSLVGAAIAKRSRHVDFLMCGHTHLPVSDMVLHGIPCLNVGAGYGEFRAVIYVPETKEIKWVGGEV